VGYSVGDVMRAADLVYCAVQRESDGRYQIIDAFGGMSFSTLAEVVACLNGRALGLLPESAQ
jgi:hypothetical protein